MGSSSKFDYNAGGERRHDPEIAKLDRDLHSNVMKRQAKYDAQKAQEEKRDDGLEGHSSQNTGNLFGGSELTKAKIKQILDSDRRIYYRTEELNDKLYLHYGGYAKLQNLEGFTGLKTLYAECNALESVEGLENCLEIRSLFLQENCFRKMTGIGRFKECWSLNLSSNFLEKIDEVRDLPKLNTLLVPKNRIGFNGVDDLLDLVGSNVSCLDLQDNKIDDPEILPEVLMRMPNLSCLYLKGNPVTKKIPNYRKTVTACLRGLKYLDDRPVFPEDRRYAEAFNRGGMEEERAERKRFKQEKDEQHRRNMENFKSMVENARKEKLERLAMRMEDKYTDDTDPVEDPDRRVARMKKEWEEKNAHELRDEAREHAEKCLAAEREGRTEKKAGETEEDEDGDEPPPLQGAEKSNAKEPFDTEAPYAPEKKVDNRKLVYDDIWDDVPAGSASSSCRAPPPTGADPEKAEKLFEQIWDQGANMLKQQGAVGAEELDRLKEMKEVALKDFKATESKKNEEPGKGAEEPKSTRMVIEGDDDDGEEECVVVEEVERKPAAFAPPGASQEVPIFAPPPRRPAATATPALATPAAEQNELDEMD